MDEAFQLFLSAPREFFLSSGKFGQGALSAIPTVAMAALVVGLAIGLYRRDARLFTFLLPVLLSQLLLLLAGIGAGRADVAAADLMLNAFMIVQCSLALLFVWRIDGTRMAATALAIFNLGYALFVAFVAANAMGTRWIA
jgi:hypothetical protein